MWDLCPVFRATRALILKLLLPVLPAFKKDLRKISLKNIPNQEFLVQHRHMRGPTDRLIAFTKNEIHPLTILHQETFSDRRGGRVSTPKMLLTVNVMSFFATTLKRKYREIITLFFALLQRSFRFSCTCLNCATLTIAGLRYPGRLIFLASSAAFALISSMCFLSLASISSDVTTLSFFSKKNKFTILDLCTC